MYKSLKFFLEEELESVKEAGLFKKERVITSPQGAQVHVENTDEVVIMCANNYLGLSSHPDVIKASKDALDTHGFGMSSVRFICGTQDIHKELERKIAEFYHTEDTILYSAAFDANGNLKIDGHKVVMADYQPTIEEMVVDFASKISSKLPDDIGLHSLRLEETKTSYSEWFAADN